MNRAKCDAGGNPLQNACHLISKRVEAGERFVIAKHRRPATKLIPFQSQGSGKVRSAINALKEFQKTHSLDGLSVRAIAEKARKR